ncbi:hypothetical protein FRC10_003949, partial [Ceratobasidium sp. 414]
MVLKITMLGSPLNALNNAKSQSEHAAAPSPLAKLRKRDMSTDRSTSGNKHVRVEPARDIFSKVVASNSKQSSNKPAAPAKHSAPQVLPLATSSRPSASHATSLAPTVASACSASSRLTGCAQMPVRSKGSVTGWGEEFEEFPGYDDVPEGEEGDSGPEGGDEGNDKDGGEDGVEDGDGVKDEPKPCRAGKKKATMGEFGLEESKIVDDVG